jgi:hypothetical protein
MDQDKNFAGRKTMIEDLYYKNEKIILVDDSIISINGVKYSLKEEPKINKENFSFNKNNPIKNILLSTVYLSYLANIDFEKKYTRKLPDNINIVEEFCLIQLKKSKLSRWEREEIIRIFEKKFEKIE